MLAKDKTCRRIEQMGQEREERRRLMIERKKARDEEEQRNIAAGNPGDVDFIGMVRSWRDEHNTDAIPWELTNKKTTTTTGVSKICVCVRKRPITEKERTKQDHDCVTCYNPYVWVHSPKVKVDGISKYLDHTSFKLDYTFNETSNTEDIYKYTTMPLIDYICTGNGGRATVFAYGQTGSGKTYTMNGIQTLVAEDLFLLLSEAASAVSYNDNKNNSKDTSQGMQKLSSCCTLDNTNISVSFFELYGGYVQDLLNNRNRLKILEDGKGEVQIPGLVQIPTYDPKEFLQIITNGNELRTTYATDANDTSSRSHAVCQIYLKDKKNDQLLKGKLSLVDLAGSERGSDMSNTGTSSSNNQQRRAESAEINTSLLSLKECIRALDQQQQKGITPSTSTTTTTAGTSHVPYRGSKLTLILKDCFTSPHARTTMIATVSPGSSASDHTMNTLRYADRIKSQNTNTSSTNTTGSRSSTGQTSTTTTTTTSASTMAGIKTIQQQQQQQGHGTASTASARTGNNRRSSVTPVEHFLQKPRTTRDSNKTATLHQQEYSSSTITSGGSQNKNNRMNRQQQQQQVEDEQLAEDQRQRKLLEEEFRRTVEAIYEQEEIILSTHMSNIQENAELLTVEGDLLTAIQNHQSGIVDNDVNSTIPTTTIDEYVSALEEILDRKEDMILNLQQHVLTFQEHLTKEKELANRIGNKALPQY